jgi:hypothetical protein
VGEQFRSQILGLFESGGSKAHPRFNEDYTEEKNARMSCSYGRATNLDWEMKSCPARSERRTKTASTREEQTSKQTQLSANEPALFWRFSAHNESKKQEQRTATARTKFLDKINSLDQEELKSSKRKTSTMP